MHAMTKSPFATLLLVPVAIFPWAAVAADATPPPSAANAADERPAWLVGSWRADPHTLRLDGDGGCSFRFFPTLSGKVDRMDLGTPGRNSWSVEAQAPAGGVVRLRGVGRGCQIRRGRADGVICLIDPIDHAEIPFYRVGRESDSMFATALEKIEAAERALQVGNRNEARTNGAGALKMLREASDPCPPLAARAAFCLARALEQTGQRENALLLYDYSIQLRERVFETAHPDLTRACFFAGRCADARSGYEESLWYFVRAALTQRQVMGRVQSAADVPPSILNAHRSETAAVYAQCAEALEQFNYSRGPVIVGPAAIRLALEAGNQQVATAASVMLFNHFLARPTDHEHSARLFSVCHFLASIDRQEARVRRSKLSDMILQDVRLAQEMPALTPPRLDLARRLALRAIAVQRLGQVDDPKYISRQILPELIRELGLANEVERLQLPAEFWPAGEPSVARAAFFERLDAVAPPVDLAAEFPSLELDMRRTPPADGDLAATFAELERLVPMLRKMAKRPAEADLEAGVRRCLTEIE